MARTQKKHKQSKGERVRIRLISKLFVLILGKKRRYFTTATQYKDNVYVVTVEKYHPIDELLQHIESIKK